MRTVKHSSTHIEFIESGDDGYPLVDFEWFGDLLEVYSSDGRERNSFYLSKDNAQDLMDMLKAKLEEK